MKSFLTVFLAVFFSLGIASLVQANNAEAQHRGFGAIRPRPALQVASAPVPDSRVQLHDDLLPLRVILEPLAGYATGFLGNIIGGLAFGGAACGTGASREGCGLAVVGGWLLGGLFLTPLGTTLVGNVAAGRGDYLFALLGTLAGSALQFGVYSVIVAAGGVTNDAGTALGIVIALSALPAIGSMLVYELVSGARNDEARQEADGATTLLPGIAPIVQADGTFVGGTASLSGTF